METSQQIELIFVIEASLGLAYIVLEGNLSISKNKDTSLWIFVRN